MNQTGALMTRLKAAMTPTNVQRTCRMRLRRGHANTAMSTAKKLSEVLVAVENVIAGAACHSKRGNPPTPASSTS